MSCSAPHERGCHLSPYGTITVPLTVFPGLYPPCLWHGMGDSWLTHPTTGGLHLPLLFTHFSHPHSLSSCSGNHRFVLCTCGSVSASVDLSFRRWLGTNRSLKHKSSLSFITGAAHYANTFHSFPVGMRWRRKQSLSFPSSGIFKSTRIPLKSIEHSFSERWKNLALKAVTFEG